MRNKIYDITISLLAVFAVLFAIIDLSSGLNEWQAILDQIILIVFIVDYFVRLYLSTNKKNFFKNNILDLISIIPFNSLFRAFRIVKITRLFKLTKLTKLSRLVAYTLRILHRSKAFLNTNGFKYMLMLSCVVLIIGGVGISYAEGMDIMDGFWWAFVTTTTVGYGDISPASIFGRIIAIILMIVGIGLIGSLTSTITTYFFNRESDTLSFKDETITIIKNRLDHIEELTPDDIDNICRVLKSLKN